MTVTSKRESIIEEIRTVALPLINGAGDYNLTVTNITRKYKHPNEYGNYPAICILDDPTISYRRLASTESYTVGSNEQDVHTGMIIELLGYVKLSESDTGDTGLLSTEVNKMFSDMILAMHSDITRGDNADCTTLIGSRNSLDWYEQGIGICLQTYEIKYDFNPTLSVT